MTQSQKSENRGFANDPKRAAEAGHKGGQMSGGNFKNDPERAAEAGKKVAKVATRMIISNSDHLL